MDFVTTYNIIVKLIEENIPMDCNSLGELLSKRIGLQSREISNIFKFISGFTIAEYVHKRIFEKIVAHKRENDCSWEEAACTYGYSDQSVFSRQFKKMYDVTPTECINGEKEVQFLLPRYIKGQFGWSSDLDIEISESGEIMDKTEYINNEGYNKYAKLMDYQAMYGLTSNGIVKLARFCEKNDIELSEMFKAVEWTEYIFEVDDVYSDEGVDEIISTAEEACEIRDDFNLEFPIAFSDCCGPYGYDYHEVASIYSGECEDVDLIKKIREMASKNNFDFRNADPDFIDYCKEGSGDMCGFLSYYTYEDFIEISKQCKARNCDEYTLHGITFFKERNPKISWEEAVISFMEENYIGWYENITSELMDYEEDEIENYLDELEFHREEQEYSDLDSDDEYNKKVYGCYNEYDELKN